MSLHALPRGRRRLLAGGLLAAALAVPAAAIWLAASATIFDQDSKVEAVQRNLSSMTAASGSITQLRKVLATLDRDARYSLDVMPPVSDTQATAALQTAAQKAISRTGAVVRSVLPLDTVEDGALRRAGVRIVMTGNTNQLNSALAAISEATPVMVVGNAEVRVLAGSRYDASPDRAPNIQATIDVLGLVRKS